MFVIKSKFGALVVAIGMLVGSCAAATRSSASPEITIGMSAPLTGENAVYGKALVAGARAYIQRANDSRVLGTRTLALVALDDANSRATAGINARVLIEKHDVVALFGFASATLTLDAIDIAKTTRTSIVAPFTGAENVRKPGLPIYLLRASYAQEIEKICEAWAVFGFQTISVVHYSDVVGNQNFESANRVLSNLKIKAISVPVVRGDKLSKATVNAVLNARTPAMLNTTAVEHFGGLLRALRQAGFSSMVSSVSFANIDEVREIAKETKTGVFMTSVVPSPQSGMQPLVVTECNEDVIKISGARSFSSVEACIAMKVLVEAIRRIKGDVTPEAIGRSLSNLGKYDAGGFPISFVPPSTQGSSYVGLQVISKSGDVQN